ncbi:MAG: DUF2076 domain-containing protein [Beijerinckiaceae bacterium]
MTPEERKVIGGIFDRLREAAGQPRDPEAERFIADRIREQPYAPYVMAQSIFVQEQAVENLSQQVQQLQAEVEELRRYADQAARQPQQSGGFLSGLFGGGQQAAPPPPRRAPFSGGRAPFGGGAPMQQPQAAPGPWGAAAQQPMGQMAQQAAPQRGGSGFLGTALTTAAGVAGGMVVGNMLMNAFKGDSGSAASASNAGYSDPGQSALPGSDTASMQGGYEDPGYGGAEETYQDAGYEDPGAGFDGGGDGGDWA